MVVFNLLNKQQKIENTRITINDMVECVEIRLEY